MKLSIIVPSIRTKRLNDLYNSINDACSYGIYPWEMIVVSPYDLTDYLWQMGNVSLIKSHRSPIAAQQQGLIEAKGEYVSWCADDGLCTPKSYDLAFNYLKGKDYKHIIVGKYYEGDTPTNMEKGYYYCLIFHDGCRIPGVPVNARLLNCGVVSRQLLMEIGGWDASTFQVCPYAYNDFSIRALKAGATFELLEEPMFKCTWTPGMEGDHGPIHVAQTEFDEPKFREIYAEDNDRVCIDVNNWKNTPEVWGLRFGG